MTYIQILENIRLLPMWELIKIAFMSDFILFIELWPLYIILIVMGMLIAHYTK